MRMSDWSSDVFSSDLEGQEHDQQPKLEQSGMDYPQRHGLLRAVTEFLHEVVEAEIVEIVPPRCDRCRYDADHADMFDGYAKDEGRERREDQQSNDFEAEGVANAVACRTHEIGRAHV